ASWGFRGLKGPIAVTKPPEGATMTTACRSLAVLGVVGLATVVVLGPGSPSPAEAAERPAGPADDSSFAFSAIGAVLDANRGKSPTTGTELQQTLRKLGEFAQLPIPFSAVVHDSGLANPRVVITARDLAGRVGSTDATRPNLVGRLFLAANMERPAPGRPD